MRSKPNNQALIAALLMSVVVVGCDEDRGMYNQQKKDPLEASEFFADEGASRHPPRGTVAAVEVDHWLSRRVRIETGNGVSGFVEPMEPERLTGMAKLRLGQTQFNVWCAPCHGASGDGDGMIVRRGYPQPPSYHTARLREAPDAHFRRVIQVGLGKMPAYADYVTAREQDAIIAYIRALQLSQHAPVEVLSSEQRASLDALEQEAREEREDREEHDEQ